MKFINIRLGETTTHPAYAISKIIFEVITPNPTMQNRVHQAIYHREYGIKSQPNLRLRI